jgi:DNA-directed RNA polymerase omega subunit
MSQVALENILDKSNFSIYKLVIIAARRALEIAEGAPQLVALDKNLKATTIALSEIAQGKVVYKKSKKKDQDE